MERRFEHAPDGGNRRIAGWKDGEGAAAAANATSASRTSRLSLGFTCRSKRPASLPAAAGRDFAPGGRGRDLSSILSARCEWVGSVPVSASALLVAVCAWADEKLLEGKLLFSPPNCGHGRGRGSRHVYLLQNDVLPPGVSDSRASGAGACPGDCGRLQLSTLATDFPPRRAPHKRRLERDCTCDGVCLPTSTARAALEAVGKSGTRSCPTSFLKMVKGSGKKDKRSSGSPAAAVAPPPGAAPARPLSKQDKKKEKHKGLLDSAPPQPPQAPIDTGLRYMRSLASPISSPEVLHSGAAARQAQIAKCAVSRPAPAPSRGASAASPV